VKRLILAALFAATAVVAAAAPVDVTLVRWPYT
jgi:hypothetical protein